MTKGQRKHIPVAGVGGVTVSIVAFQAVDPGSTPGQRIIFCLIPVGVVWSVWGTIFFWHDNYFVSFDTK